jgi:hypothetical protein
VPLTPAAGGRDAVDADLLRRSGSAYLRRHEGSHLAAALPAPDLARYDASQVAFASRAWTLKAEEEHRSAAVFAEIVAGCLHLCAPLDLVATLARIVRDEIAHAALCLDLSVRFGAPPPTAAPGRVRARLDALGPDRERQALVLLLFEGAVGETVSVGLFRAGRRGAREPCTRAALTAILRDEARHARACWHAAAELVPRCSAALREQLERDLSRSFGAFEQAAALPALRRLEAGQAVDPALVELGVIPPEARVEAFYQAIEALALPQLSLLGFDSRRAWEERYRA